MAITFPSSTDTAVTWPVSSLATNSSRPSALKAVCSGSDPAGSTRSSFRSATLTTPMPSAFLSGGGSLDSSTPGGAIGEPLNATNKVVPSGLRRMPRGRLPTGMVATTFCSATSTTLMSPPVSLVTNNRPALGAGGAAGAAVSAGGGAEGDEHDTAAASNMPRTIVRVLI